MFERPPLPAYAGEPDAESLAAAEVVLARRRLEILDEVAEMALDLARAHHRPALEQLEPSGEAAAMAEGPPAPAGRERDAMAGFISATRIVRLTLMVQARLQHGLNVRRGELSAERKVRIERERLDSTQAWSRKADHLADVVAEVIEVEAGDRPDVDRLADAGRTAVWDRQYDSDFEDAPISSAVAMICESLGIQINWPNWATEDWAIAEAKAKVEGSPFVKPAGNGGAAPPANGSGAYGVAGTGPQATGPP